MRSSRGGCFIFTSINHLLWSVTTFIFYTPGFIMAQMKEKLRRNITFFLTTFAAKNSIFCFVKNEFPFNNEACFSLQHQLQDYQFHGVGGLKRKKKKSQKGVALVSRSCTGLSHVNYRSLPPFNCALRFLMSLAMIGRNSFHFKYIPWREIEASIDTFNRQAFS